MVNEFVDKIKEMNRRQPYEEIANLDNDGLQDYLLNKAWNRYKNKTYQANYDIFLKQYKKLSDKELDDYRNRAKKRAGIGKEEEQSENKSQQKRRNKRRQKNKNKERNKNQERKDRKSHKHNHNKNKNQKQNKQDFNQLDGILPVANDNPRLVDNSANSSVEKQNDHNNSHQDEGDMLLPGSNDDDFIDSLDDDLLDNDYSDNADDSNLADEIADEENAAKNDNQDVDYDITFDTENPQNSDGQNVKSDDKKSMPNAINVFGGNVPNTASNNGLDKSESKKETSADSSNKKEESFDPKSQNKSVDKPVGKPVDNKQNQANPVPSSNREPINESVKTVYVTSPETPVRDELPTNTIVHKNDKEAKTVTLNTFPALIYDVAEHELKAGIDFDVKLSTKEKGELRKYLTKRSRTVVTYVYMLGTFTQAQMSVALDEAEGITDEDAKIAKSYYKYRNSTVSNQLANLEHDLRHNAQETNLMADTILHVLMYQFNDRKLGIEGNNPISTSIKTFDDFKNSDMYGDMTDKLTQEAIKQVQEIRREHNREEGAKYGFKAHAKKQK